MPLGATPQEASSTSSPLVTISWAEVRDPFGHACDDRLLLGECVTCRGVDAAGQGRAASTCVRILAPIGLVATWLRVIVLWGGDSTPRHSVTLGEPYRAAATTLDDSGGGEQAAQLIEKAARRLADTDGPDRACLLAALGATPIRGQGSSCWKEALLARQPLLVAPLPGPGRVLQWLYLRPDQRRQIVH